jgi:hypothetical protein
MAPAASRSGTSRRCARSRAFWWCAPAANEDRCAWQLALPEPERPTVLVFTRQAVHPGPHAVRPADGLRRGAYILNPRDDGAQAPDVILMGTGELSLIVEAAVACAAGVRAQLVSVPCWRRSSRAPVPRVSPAAQVTARGRRGRFPFGWGAGPAPRHHRGNRSLRPLRPGPEALRTSA